MNNEVYYLTLLRIVEEIIKNTRKQDFLTYFKKLSIVDLGEDFVKIGVMSDFAVDNLSYRFYDEVKTSVQAVLGDKIKMIKFVVDKDIENPSNTNAIDCQKEINKSTSKKKDEPVGETNIEGIASRTMSQKYKLDNFIVGPSNQLAFAACDSISRRPGVAYNPLFIYGDVGLGKTHLLQATGNAIKSRSKDKRILYTTADRFTTDYVNSVQKRTTDKLRDKYRNIDVIIIDDVQFLANKKQTQEELYNIFNVMYENNKQIIISSDRPPRELTELEPRLQSRFEWGITVDIGAPDFETRLAILQEKAREREFMLPQDVAEFIAQNTGSNVREIEGILNQIVAEYELNNTPPTINNVAARMNKLSITENLIGNNATRNKIKGYNELIEIVSEHFGIDKKSVMGDNRKKENMIPRQVAMYLLKNKMNYTYERIGNIFGGRNHSAILYSCHKLEKVLKKNQNLFYEINVIKDKLGF